MFKAAILLLVITGCVSSEFTRFKLKRNYGQRSYGRFKDPKINVTLIDHEGDMYYTGSIYLSNPRKEFTVDFDTGSPTTWVAGKGCKIEGQDECEEQIHRYDLKESKSGRDIHKHFVIRYESGHAEGQFVSDILSFSANGSGLTTDNSFVFGYANEISKDFREFKADGIFGLSFASESNDYPFIDYLKDHNVFENPIFTFWLERNVSDQVIGGELIFGDKDDSRCGEEIVTVKAGIIKPWWTFSLDAVYLGGKQISEQQIALTDTGTTLMYVSKDAYKAIAEKYPFYNGTGAQKLFECDKYKDFSLDFSIGNKNVTLTSKNLFLYNGDGQCTIGIINGAENMNNMWLLGDPFLKSFCQIHNYKDETLTLTSSKHVH